MQVDVNKIIKIELLKLDESRHFDICKNGETLIEFDVELDDLIDIMNEIDTYRNWGIRHDLHSWAFTGFDWLGKEVKYSSYVVWQFDDKIFKFNFSPDLIPFNGEILRRGREDKISSLI